MILYFLGLFSLRDLLPLGAIRDLLLFGSFRFLGTYGDFWVLFLLPAAGTEGSSVLFNPVLCYYVNSSFIVSICTPTTVNKYIISNAG